MIQVYSVAEAIALSRSCRSVFYHAIKDGELVAHKRGRRTLILAENLQRWLESMPQLKAGPRGRPLTTKSKPPDHLQHAKSAEVDLGEPVRGQTA